MLTVDEHDLIRRKHLVDGMSLRAISRELGYARHGGCFTSIEPSARPRSKRPV